MATQAKEHETKNPKRRRTVCLTYQDAEAILVHYMGWEYIDADAFWQRALKLHETGTR